MRRMVGASGTVDILSGSAPPNPQTLESPAQLISRNSFHDRDPTQSDGKNEPQSARTDLLVAVDGSENPVHPQTLEARQRSQVSHRRFYPLRQGLPAGPPPL